jgi:hypothetical protein
MVGEPTQSGGVDRLSEKVNDGNEINIIKNEPK